MTVTVLTTSLVNNSADSVARLVTDKVASRIAAKDDSLWGEVAQPEAGVRLNWLDAPANVNAIIASLRPVLASFKNISEPRVVLCGMGGSSLGPEVIAKAQGLNLEALDATDPDQVARELENLQHTIVVNSSKSGSTVETDSHRRVFEAAFKNVGIDPTTRIVFVTDPGSPLAQDATKNGYSNVVLADPNIGGRFSVLAAFGIVPTVLLGGNAQRLADEALELLPSLTKDVPENPALVLAAALANNNATVNKILIVEDPDHAVGLGDWIEQLIAESTGKDQSGILPVIVEHDAPELKSHASDTLTVWLGSEERAASFNIEVDVVVDAPLGAQFILWEYATAVMGRILDLDPFNQPDVESAKQAARALLDGDLAKYQLSTESIISLHSAENLGIESDDLSAEQVSDCIHRLMRQLEPGTYLSIQAYLDRPGNPEYRELRDEFAALSGRPTTFGWGPRFLHSTGQYHKGGHQQGVFLQLIHRGELDMAIPGREFSFGQLMLAQADGDRKVLAERGRPVLSLSVTDPAAALTELQRILNSSR